MIRDHKLMILCEKYDHQVHIQICKYIYYKQPNTLHISATYCGHLQVGVLGRMYCIDRQNNLICIYKVLSCK
jgi:hypothetical protein